jgi:hypothetical protein
VNAAGGHAAQDGAALLLLCVHSSHVLLRCPLHRALQNMYQEHYVAKKVSTGGGMLSCLWWANSSPGPDTRTILHMAHIIIIITAAALACHATPPTQLFTAPTCNSTPVCLLLLVILQLRVHYD